MWVVSLSILNEIVFTSVIYATTLYQNSKCDITDFAWIEYCCDLVRGIPTCFQVLDQLVAHIFPVWGRSSIFFFGKFCISFIFTIMVLVLSELQCRCICTYAYMNWGETPLCTCKCTWFLDRIKFCSIGILFLQVLPSGS